MNKSIFFIYFICLLSLNSTFSQDGESGVRVEWNEELIAKHLPNEQMFSLSDDRFLLFGEDQIYTFHSKFQFNILDKDLKRIQSKEIIASEYCKKCNKGKIIALDNRYFLLLESKKLDELKIFELNTETLSLTDTNKTLKKIKSKKNRALFSTAGKESKYYFHGYFHRPKGAKAGQLEVSIYDHQFNLLQSNQIEISGSIRYQDFTAGSDGQFWLLTKRKRQSLENGRSTKTYFSSLYFTSAEIDHFKTTLIPPEEGKELGDLSITAGNKENTCLVYGQYYDDEIQSVKRKTIFTVDTPKNMEKKGKPAAGRVGITFHSENGLSERHYSRFQADVLAPTYEENKQYKAALIKDTLNGIAKLFNTRIDPLDNGDYACLAEVYTIANLPGSGPLLFGDGSTGAGDPGSSEGYYGKILLSVSSSDGQTKWERSIDRIQRQKSEAYKSDLIFREHQIGVVYLYGKSTYVNLYDIETGSMTQHMIHTNGKMRKSKIPPSLIQKINEDRFLLYRTRRGKGQFGLLIFD